MGAETAVGTFAFWLGVLAAFLTAFYSWRLLILTFHGTPRADDSVMARVHESPKVMLVPMMVLALGAVSAGFIAYDAMVGHHWDDFWRGSIFVCLSIRRWRMRTTFLSAKLLPGSGDRRNCARVHLLRYGALAPRMLAARFMPSTGSLLNKWYFDELYDALFVRPAFALGRGFWKGGDGA